MILDASSQKIIWYTFSEAQEPKVLSDFNWLGEATTYENKVFTVRVCIRKCSSLASLKAMGQWCFTTDCSGTKVSFIRLYLRISKKYTQTSLSKYINVKCFSVTHYIHHVKEQLQIHMLMTVYLIIICNHKSVLRSIITRYLQSSFFSVNGKARTR